jgi:hypothetical protein
MAAPAYRKVIIRMTGLETVELAVTGLLPVVVAVMFHIVSSLNSKIAEIDSRLRTAVSHSDVRLLIDDKINPLKEDIHEIKLKLDKLLDIYYPHKEQR